QDGTYNLPVRAEINDLRASDINVVFSPSTVPVYLETQETKAYPVVAVVTGNPKLGFTGESAQVSPQQVTVTGPRDDVSRIAKLIVTADIEGRSGDWQSKSSPVPIAADGREVVAKDLTLEP